MKRFCNLRTLAVLWTLLAMVAGSGCNYFNPEARKRHYVESGQRYLQKGRYQEAQLEFRNALKIDPRYDEAYYGLGRCNENLLQWADARKNYETTINLSPDRLDARLSLGRIYLMARNYRDAEEQAQQVLRRAPKNEDGYLLLASTYFLWKDYPKAEESYLALLKIAPRNAQAMQGLALVELGTQRPERGTQHLVDAIQADPHLVNAYNNLASVYLRTQQADKAIELLSRGIAANPDADTLYFRLGDLRYQRNERDAAAKLMQDLRAHRGDTAPLANQVADFYAGHHDVQRALDEYQHGLSLDKKSIDLRNGLVEMYLSQEQLDAAEKTNNEVLKQAPSNLMARVHHARLLLAHHQVDEAINSLQQIPDAPDAAMAHYVLGMAYLENQRANEAIGEWEAAVRIDPSLAVVWQGLAGLHLQLGHMELAEQDARRAMQLAPNDAGNSLAIAEALIQKGNLREARQYLALAQQALPNGPLVHVGFAMAYQKENKYADAEREYEQALKMDPRCKQALEGLMGLLRDSHQTAKIEPRLRQLIAASPQDFRPHLYLSDFYAGNKRYNDAAASAQAALKLNPQSSAAYLILGRISEEQGQVDAAIGYYQQVLKLRPKMGDLQTLVGNLFQAKGDLPMAAKYYEAALNSDPTYGPAAGNLAWVYAEQGVKLDDALTLAQRAKRLSPNLDAITDTLGWVHYKRTAYALAVPLFRECVHDVPDHAVYHYHLGMALLGTGNKPQAKAELTAALQLKLEGPAANSARQALQQIR